MDFSIRDPDTGQIKSWVWIVGGIGVVGVIAVFVGQMGTTTSSGGSTAPDPTTSGGQSSDATDSLTTLNDLIKQLLNQEPTTTDPKVKPAKPTTAAGSGHIWSWNPTTWTWFKKAIPIPKQNAGPGYHWGWSAVKDKWVKVKTKATEHNTPKPKQSAGSGYHWAWSDPKSKWVKVKNKLKTSSSAVMAKPLGITGTSNVPTSVGTVPLKNPTNTFASHG